MNKELLKYFKQYKVDTLKSAQEPRKELDMTLKFINKETDEKNISAFQKEKKKQARFPWTNGLRKWTPRTSEPSC